MARRKRNDPAKTHAAACFRPKTKNSTMPEATRGLTTLESMRAVATNIGAGLFIPVDSNVIMEYGEAATYPTIGPGYRRHAYRSQFSSACAQIGRAHV